MQQPRDSGDTLKRVWRTIYGTTLAIVLAGLGATTYCVFTHRPDGAIGSLALFLVGVIAFRMAWEIDVLHRRRMRLATEERLFEAERGVHERDVDRARHELADEERAMVHKLNVERATLHRQLDDERDQLQIEFDAKKAAIRNAAFAKGFEMGENGIAAESRNADVIVLPVGANAPTIMGTGTTHP